MTRASLACSILAVLALAPQAAAQAGSREARAFVVTDTSVEQGTFVAVAVSPDTIYSNYPRAAREIRFRFSINGHENEFPPGTEHTIYLRPTDGRMLTPLYRFGVESAPAPPTPDGSPASEDGVAQVTFQVDLRHVHAALRDSGWYQPPLGDRVARGDLRSVFVVGDPEPLTWDYRALRPGHPAELTDPDGDGIYTGAVRMAAEYTRPRAADGRAYWARHREVDAYPRLQSAQRLQDALYRLSLEELEQLVRDDGAFSAGAKWPGVWTRDVALASVLALAIIAPDATRRSLLAKVDTSGRIIQDTGTGGSWPISSDRMVWALAAWELYAATGDRGWLQQAYGIIRRSAEADLHAVRDPATGLFNGESSFLDWREQSYPRWMQPADIYRSQNLGTNAIHFAAYRILGDMARVLGEPAARWDSVSTALRQSINARLWQSERGWYGQYRYGRAHLSLSPRAEALGEALATIYGVASPAQRGMLMRTAPLTAFGAPTFWPYIPGERFYHNAAIWPFVTAYWSWAAADADHAAAVQHGLDNATRAAALFLTNKENMVAATGHYEGTALNSDRQLWSVAGTLASTYRLLFGIRLEPDRMVLRPVVPPSYAGDRMLTGMRYRAAILDLTVRGFGDSVAAVRIDGVPADAEIPAALTGRHQVEIVMNERWRADSVALVDHRFAPPTPQVRLQGTRLVWDSVPGAVGYVVVRNARPVRRTTMRAIRVRPADALAEYQVLAVNGAGDESFLSEPVRVAAPSVVRTARPVDAPLEREHAGFSGAGYIRLTAAENRSVRIPLRVGAGGAYAVDVRYANGSGPVNTEDKAAVRTLLVNGDTAGVVVMPQRGANAWSDWGWSNVLHVRLRPGANLLTLVYSPSDANMNRRENTALVDHVRVTRVDSVVW